ncbi:MAG: hypothetical protein ACLFVW_04050 [Phycisphaerae bacterium]
MSELPHAATVNEAKYFLMVTPCPGCGKGPWLLDDSTEPAASGEKFSIDARCKSCGREETFEFVCDSASRDEDAELISASESPSGLIDVAQWLSLFYRHIETAADDNTPARERRLLGYRAALCLREALKFYGEEDELPDASAFFTEPSRDAFREHPESFAREKLLDMRSKLPKLGAMAQSVKSDREKTRKRWWQFRRK